MQIDKVWLDALYTLCKRAGIDFPRVPPGHQGTVSIAEVRYSEQPDPITGAMSLHVIASFTPKRDKLRGLPPERVGVVDGTAEEDQWFWGLP